MTEADWDKFVSEQVVPRFPHGFSVQRADGHWRGANGQNVQERAYVVTLIHDDTVTGNQAVVDIATTYRTAFRQEAVLRVRQSVCSAL